MYERMLDKQKKPSIDEMREYCGETGALFALLNEWLTSTFKTVQEQAFPYGNKYGWGIAHRKKKKLMCHVFAERNAFTIMVRLSDREFTKIYPQLQKYAQEYIDQKYPCGDGGWIHYRVTCKEQLDDIQKILAKKCS